MKNIPLFALLMLLGTLQFANAQVSITNAAPTATVNFSNSMQTTVGTNPSTAYEGDGFEPNPTMPGRLNSNAWEVKGWSFGNCLFGGVQTVDDFGRGSVTGGVITPGMYAFTDLPATVANPAMMIQPGAGDFNPGSITLRIRNNGTSNLTQIAIDYNVFVRNDEVTSSSFNFSHSPDNAVFVSEPLLDYTSPDVPDAFQWVNIGTAPSRTCIINGINIAPGAYYYVRWSSSLLTGAGESDEFGLDDIVITGTYGSPAPEINVTCYSSTLLSGDVTPTVAEGTDFAPSYAPQSTLLTTQSISYTIQNLGGLALNVTNVTITGANASDFSLSFFTPGSIPAASATISVKGFTITFDPSAPGLRTARVNIFSDDSNENPYFFDIQGYGFIPIPDIQVNGGPTGGTSIVTNGSLIPSTFNNTLFSSQTVGGAGEIKGFEIRNTGPGVGNAPLLLTDASPYITIGGLNPADFSLVLIPIGNSINPGFKKQFTIKFAPTAIGIRSAIVTINSNDPDESPFTYLVQGTGVSAEMDVTGNAQPVVSGTTTTSFVNYTFFDYLNINTGTLDRTFTITNNGNVALTMGTLTITGTNAADFSVITAPPATLGIGLSTTFTLRFDPSAVGLRTATVSIINNDLNENPYTFAISGYGLDYIPCSFAAIETLGIQDFEAVPVTPVWPYTATGTSAVAGGTGFGATGDAGASSRFVGARSFQVVNGTATLTMNNVNTTQYSVVEMDVRLASMSVNAAEGSDAGDKVMISVSTDGTTWSNEVEVIGNTDAKWNFTSGTGIASGIYDGNNVLTTFSPSAGGFLTTNGFSTISLTGLPKSATLGIRIAVTNNNANEIWAIDNVRLFGRKEVSTTWNGSAWSAGAPSATVKAVIDGNYNTGTFGNLSGCKCEIKPGRTVTINSNNYFDIQSDVDNSGTLVIENSGSLVQHNDLATNIGIAKVKRYTTNMVAYDYSYWSSPVAGQTLFALSPNTRFDKYFSFSPTIGNWVVSMNGTDIMTPGKGYIVRAPQNFTAIPQPYTAGEFNGIPNNGFIQTAVVIGASNMNLLGNPYPSAISANAFLSNAANTGVVEGTIYLWTHNSPIGAYVYNANDYAVYNFSGSVGTRAALTGGVSTNVPTGNIASGQGFFIKGLANGNVTFNNSMRITGGNNIFFRSGQSTSETAPNSMDGIEKHRVWLNLSNAEGAFKQTLVGYIEGATNDIDRGFDGELFNANSFVSLYSIVNGKSMAIQGKALPFNAEDKVALGYNSNVAGVFEISIDNFDGDLETSDIYLEDKLLHVVHDLKASNYTFETEVGTFDSRFELRYTNSTLGTDNFATAGNALIVTTNDKQINLYSQEENMKGVTVYDLLGRNIFEDQKVNAKKFTINNVISNDQALVLKIVLGNGKVVTRKVIL